MNEPEKKSGVCPEGRPRTGLRTDNQDIMGFSASPGSSVLVLEGSPSIMASLGLLAGLPGWVAEPLWASFPHLYIGDGDNDMFLH